MYQEDMEFLSAMLQVWGLIATAAFTFMWHRRKWALAVGPVLMLPVNFVAQVIIAGEGPGACVGTFILPIYGLLVSWATLGVARRFKWVQKG